MMRSSLAWSLCLLGSTGLAPLLSSSSVFAQPETLAGADSQAQTLKPASRRFESPERFSIELRGGPYTPAIADKSYGRFFGGDIGPNLGVQVDGIVYRKPKIFYLTVGGSVGTLNF
jgi:hypothetical protein